jgi:hypothetical protein
MKAIMGFGLVAHDQCLILFMPAATLLLCVVRGGSIIICLLKRRNKWAGIFHFAEHNLCRTGCVNTPVLYSC